MEAINVNEKAVERLKRKIIIAENQNLKTRDRILTNFGAGCVCII